ncbi:ABC transporter permease [Neobacillus piezotolerans]|uniref:ABC transporter permease n=1 Tax=Neobacillus piezotolerans TaxID=2259171 RepID=A0A3D8GLI7_9BACI|nr:ABC transporter permease [Neobacillus piezotolerans]RDU35293.1 ABC transporter permease [Neobacillus piezotolerans]
MFDENKLWRERAGNTMKELSRYLKYIFNGHIVIVLFFLLGTAAFYYQNWLKTVDPGFPTEIIMGLVFSVALTFSPVYNFLKEPDKVFLLPLEDRLRSYFLRSAVASGALQGYVLLMLLALFMPLLARTTEAGFGNFLPILLILLALKAWNITAEWKVAFLGDSAKIPADKLIRFILNAGFSYFLFSWNGLFILVPFAGIMFAYLGYCLSAARGKGLKWEALIAGEERRMMAFYRLANMFTDVPHLKESVKRRRWLDFLLAKIQFGGKHASLYLLSRTFIRSGDYLGLSIRLVVIGALAIALISYWPGQVFFAVLFLYLTGFQLMPLASHHENSLWESIYPVPDGAKKAAFQHVLGLVMAVQSVIFAAAIAFRGELAPALGALAAGALFTFVFVRYYSVRKLKN